MTKDLTDDLRVTGYNALLTPNYVKEEFPLVNCCIVLVRSSANDIRSLKTQRKQ